VKETKIKTKENAATKKLLKNVKIIYDKNE
jgi:hypothetical protein